MSPKTVWTRYSFGWVTLALFLITLTGHWIFGWLAYVREQHDHGPTVEVAGYTSAEPEPCRKAPSCITSGRPAFVPAFGLLELTNLKRIGVMALARIHALSTTPSALADTFARLFHLTSTEREHLQRLTVRTEDIEPRRKLIIEGRPGLNLFILTAGWLYESKLLRNGARQILNFRLPGDIVGIECLAFKEALHSTTTLTISTVAPLSVQTFEQTQREFPRLASALFLMALRDGAIRHEWEVNIGRRTALSRVAHLFAELDRRIHERGLALDGTVPMPLTQEEIADCAGLTPPYVNRILQQLRIKGLVRFEHKTLEILDRIELAKMAGFDPNYIEGWGHGKSSFGSE